MHTILRAYPLTPTETQLELEGTYAPPLTVPGEGIVTDDLTAVMGRRIAEASMLRFIQEVAVHLRAELAPAVGYARGCGRTPRKTAAHAMHRVRGWRS
jgi:hypothetical protein